VKRIAILGGGSWGTALALILSRSCQAHRISLWVHDPELAVEIERTRQNRRYLAGLQLPEQVRVTYEIGAALKEASIVVGAMPSANAREIYSTAAGHVSAGTIVVSATKGLEPATHLRISEVIGQSIPSSISARIAVLSGPSFAQEVAQGGPTAVVIASFDMHLAAQLQEDFASPNFRLYTNDDVLGVELAGAMKNVIAIAAGASQGLGLGSNALAALITRGLAEMSRLAGALGARSETLSGLAGLGDLVLTCTGALSRNRRVGMELGKGRALDEILSGMHSVAEGIGTAAALLKLARENKIEMPITEQVDLILRGQRTPADAIREIMERRLRRE
jgi:glycerol-3-phosphate dehydrogenase (NAD(P)+)